MSVLKSKYCLKAQNVILCYSTWIILIIYHTSKYQDNILYSFCISISTKTFASRYLYYLFIYICRDFCLMIYVWLATILQSLKNNHNGMTSKIAFTFFLFYKMKSRSTFCRWICVVIGRVLRKQVLIETNLPSITGLWMSTNSNPTKEISWWTKRGW